MNMDKTWIKQRKGITNKKEQAVLPFLILSPLGMLCLIPTNSNV